MTARALAIVIGLLGGCGSAGERAPAEVIGAAPAASSAPMTPAAVAATPPAGWVALAAPPDDARLHCANYAEDEWRVAIEHDAVVATAATSHEPDTGPALPFTPKSEPQPRGRRHVVPVADGFLVGFDAGEWGGSLHWFSQDGARTQQLGDTNVHGVVVLAPNLAASIEGLSHMGISEGAVRWLERANASAPWRSTSLTKLAAGPSAFAVTADLSAIYIVTSEDLERVERKARAATVVQPMRTAILYPDAMAIDASGALWLGMRQFVVRMRPHGERFDETFFTRSSCVHATTTDHLTCTCAP